VRTETTMTPHYSEHAEGDRTEETRADGVYRRDGSIMSEERGVGVYCEAKDFEGRYKIEKEVS
jgi:hypothetical protein